MSVRYDSALQQANACEAARNCLIATSGRRRPGSSRGQPRAHWSFDVDSFEWNKIFGGVLAGLVAVLGVSITSDMMFARHLPEKPGYEVAGAEEAPAAGAAAAEVEKPAAFYLASADVAKGEAVFKKCAACHKVGDGAKNGAGPMLNGVVGHKAGSVEGFKYSPAMLAAGEAGLIWDEASLDAYLADPKAAVPKNKMSFAGLKKPEDRAALIAYLSSFSQ